MENTFSLMKSLFEKIEGFGKTSYELYKLKSISKTVEVVSTFAFRGALLIILLMGIFFASIGLSLWLGALLDQPYLGFLCVAAFYIVLGAVLLFFLRIPIKRRISNSMITEILNNK